MGSQELGECSRKTECSDTSTENEQPLKKARHVWHSKEGSSKDFNSNVESDSTSTTTNYNNLKNKHENKRYNGRNCLEILMSRPGALFDSIDSSDDDVDRMLPNKIPLSIDPVNQDHYLRKWQQEEQAKGFMENALNKVLETFMTVSSDISDFLENHENDEQVEDEGILMAIQLHGLQPNVEYSGELNINQNDCKFSSCRCIKEKVSEKNYENVEAGDHSNFLDTAVSVAIQKKGLLSQNYM